DRIPRLNGASPSTDPAFMPSRRRQCWHDGSTSRPTRAGRVAAPGGSGRTTKSSVKVFAHTLWAEGEERGAEGVPDDGMGFQARLNVWSAPSRGSPTWARPECRRPVQVSATAYRLR